MSHFNMYVPARVLFGAGQLNCHHEQPMPRRKATMTLNAEEPTGFLFLCDRKELSVADCISIYQNSYK